MLNADCPAANSHPSTLNDSRLTANGQRSSAIGTKNTRFVVFVLLVICVIFKQPSQISHHYTLLLAWKKTNTSQSALQKRALKRNLPNQTKKRTVKNSCSVVRFMITRIFCSCLKLWVKPCVTGATAVHFGT